MLLAVVGGAGLGHLVMADANAAVTRADNCCLDTEALPPQQQRQRAGWPPEVPPLELPPELSPLRTRASDETQLRIEVDGMTCQRCVQAVTAVLLAVPCVQKAEVDLLSGVAEVAMVAGAAKAEVGRAAVQAICDTGRDARAV